MSKNIFKKFIQQYETEKGETRWKAVLPDGRGAQCRKQGFYTQEAAIDWVTQEHERTRLGYIKSKQTFCDYAEEYLLEEKDVKAGTRQSFEEIIRLYLRPYFKSVHLTELFLPTASGFLTSLHRNKKISGTHKRKIFFTFKQVYKKALASGYAPDFRVLSLDAPRKDTLEAECWSSEEMQFFLNCTELKSDERFYICVAAAMMGCRAGEIVALEWRDFDLDSDSPTVTLNKSRCQKSGIEYKGTKNGDSRIVDLTPDALTLFREFKTSQGMVWPKNKVFGPTNDQKHFARHLRVMCERVGLKVITFHQLRHSYLTFLASQGVDSSLISMIAGHRDEKTTAIYIHKSRPMQKLLWEKNKGRVVSLLQTTQQNSNNISEEDSESGVIAKA